VFIARHVDTRHATWQAHGAFAGGTVVCGCIAALRCCECHRPPFSRASSIVGSFWHMFAHNRLTGSQTNNAEWQNSNNYLSFDWCRLQGPEQTASRRAVGDRVTPRHSTQANDITTWASMVASDTALFWAVAAAAERESFVGGHSDSFCYRAAWNADTV